MKQQVLKISVFTIILILGCLFVIEPSFAQCPMCKSAAEANLRDGGTHALGLNAGIIYLFLTPYLLVAVIGCLWWWNKRKAEKTATNQAIQTLVETQNIASPPH